MTKNNLVRFLVMTSLTLSACSSSNNSSVTAAEDSSTSGMAASSVGGAISSSSSSGTVASLTEPKSIWSRLLNSATAANACPKIITANGSGCTNASGAVDLT
ncbi:MAG: hypothetical protein ACXVCP_16620 [Bdellovibrio sp.]